MKDGWCPVRLIYKIYLLRSDKRVACHNTTGRLAEHMVTKVFLSMIIVMVMMMMNMWYCY